MRGDWKEEVTMGAWEMVAAGSGLSARLGGKKFIHWVRVTLPFEGPFR